MNDNEPTIERILPYLLIGILICVPGSLVITGFIFILRCIYNKLHGE